MYSVSYKRVNNSINLQLADPVRKLLLKTGQALSNMFIWAFDIKLVPCLMILAKQNFSTRKQIINTKQMNTKQINTKRTVNEEVGAQNLYNEPSIAKLAW